MKTKGKLLFGMRITRDFILFFVLFTFILLVMRYLGLPDLTLTFIFAFSLLLIGLVLVYFGFDLKNKLSVFFGALCFMSGITIFLLDNFYFAKAELMYIPGGLFILSISFLMVYFTGNRVKAYLLISIGFIITALVFIQLKGKLDPNDIIFTLREVFDRYWFILALALLSLLIIIAAEGSKEPEEQETENDDDLTED